MLTTMLNVDPACSLANVENVSGWPRPWAQVGRIERFGAIFGRFVALFEPLRLDLKRALGWSIAGDYSKC